MSPFDWVRAQVNVALAPDECDFLVEPSREGGEVMTNAALVLGGASTRELAECLAAKLRRLPEVADAQVAGPGFVNLTMEAGFWAEALSGMLANGFKGRTMGPGAVAAEGLFAIQYAHARCHSVLRHAAEMWPEVVTSDAALARAPLARLTAPAELGLIRLLAGWSRVNGESARVAGFLADTAAAFDALWAEDRGDFRLRLLDPGDLESSLGRLALVRAVASALATGLVLLGFQPMEEMR